MRARRGAKAKAQRSGRFDRIVWNTIPTTMLTQISLGNQAGNIISTRHGQGLTGMTKSTLLYTTWMKVGWTSVVQDGSGLRPRSRVNVLPPISSYTGRCEAIVFTSNFLSQNAHGRLVSNVMSCLRMFQGYKANTCTANIKYYVSSRATKQTET